jgi:hypothetical protein
MQNVVKMLLEEGSEVIRLWGKTSFSSRKHTKCEREIALDLEALGGFLDTSPIISSTSFLYPKVNTLEINLIVVAFVVSHVLLSHLLKLERCIDDHGDVDRAESGV